MRPNEATMEAPKPTLVAVLEKENLNRAWEGVRANKGAPGPDGRDIASSQAHMRENWENIEAKLGNRGQCAFSFIFLKTNSWQVDCGWDLREKGQSHILTYFKLREPSSDGTSAVRHLKILLSESTNCPPCK